MAINNRLRRILQTAAAKKGGGVVVPTNFQVVTTYNGLASVKYPGTTGGRTDVQLQMRSGHYLGAAGVKRWKIGQGAYVAPQNNNNGDQAVGNSFNYEAALERVTGGALNAHAQFSGANTVTVADNAALVLSDEFALDVSADDEIFSRQGIVIGAASQNFPQSVRSGQDGTRVLSPATASQIGGTGALTTPSGGTTTSVSAWPLVLGVPDKPQMAVLVIGHSIAEGQGETSVPNGTSNSGPYRRAFWNVDGHHIPFDFHAVSGRSFAGYTPVTSPNPRSRWPYCTHAIIDLARNSMGLGIAGLKAATVDLINELRATIGPYGKRLHVSVTCPIPSTASSNWIDAASQNPNAGFENGGTRDQYVAWIKGFCDGLIDDYIDYSSVVEDPTDHTKFLTNGTANWPTTDGTHPTSNLYGPMSGIVVDWVRRQVPIPSI
ncbi:hypothetical protein FHX08_002082 [Rhizobium sp. BK529]|uniref:hypothetical protein n=1 Tax=Rhizobium sp. BK529 TaxID=2586983 RepID=UPI00161710AE|nr:hypothetical protein [Rhizobium sp. BK529]MBB3591738.1 hypothetical protein [Rhizobium sp. BK529]